MSPPRRTTVLLPAIIMLVIGLLAGALPVWARRSVAGPGACKANFMMLKGALEMYALDNDLSQHDLQNMNEDVFPRLVEGGYMGHVPYCPLDRRRESGGYRLIDGDVFCPLHGFFPTDDFGVVPAREQLIRRGITDPALLAEANPRIQRNPRRVFPLRGLDRHFVCLYLGLLAIVVGLVLVGDLIVYGRTGHLPTISAESSVRMQRHLTWLLYGTAVFLVLSLIAIIAVLGPAAGEFREYPETLALMALLIIIAGAVGWVSGRMLGRRIAALGGGVLSLIDSYGLYFLAVTGAVLSWIPRFGRQAPFAEGQDIFLLILLSIAARLWTARSRLRTLALQDSKPAPIGLQGVSASPSRPAN